MNNNTSALFSDIEKARADYISAISELSHEQVKFKTSPSEWSVLQITEHLVWAEQVGICGMFNAVEGIKQKQPIWNGTSENEGLTIEEIVERTWRTKEKVPDVAAPRFGGSIRYWVASLRNCAHLLGDLSGFINGVNLREAIYPHPLSGPLDVVQRLQFLRFHLERHKAQAERVIQQYKQHMNL